MRAAANIRIVPDAPSPFPSPQDPGLLDNQSLLCVHSLTVNRKAILEDQRFLKKYFPSAGKSHSYHIYLGGWVGADCVIFFQEIESNLRSMEVQFGMNDFS